MANTAVSQNEDEETTLGANVTPGGAEPTSNESGPGGSTPANNSSVSPAQQNAGARPGADSQVEQQADLAPNITPYLNSTANQNEIAGTATGISNTLTGETNQSNDAITAGNANLQGAVTAGTPQVNNTANQDIVNNPTSISSADQSTLDNELSGTYSGPTSATSSFTNAQTPSQNAAQDAAVLEQPNQEGPATYFADHGVQGAGNQTLDAALLEQTPSAQAAIHPAVLSAQAAPADVSGAIEQGNNVTIPTGTANATATQAATQAALQGGITNYTNQGNTAAAGNISAYDTLAQNTQTFLQTPTTISGTPTPQQQQILSALGYTPAQWNEIATAYNNLAQIQYIQTLVSQSGMPITQDPTTGKFYNQLTGDEIVIPTNIPPPSGVDLSKGLNVGNASALFNMSNSADPAVLKDISALEGLLGQSTTVQAQTGQNGTQFTYTPPNMSSEVTAAQTALTNANNSAQAAINTARGDPTTAMKSGTSLGVAYAIGGAALAAQVAQAGIKVALGNTAVAGESTLATALGNSTATLAGKLGASDAVTNGASAGAQVVGEALSVIGAAYGIYNFIAGYQSGNSAADAINGAEAGAEIGSLVGPIGTLVGGAIGAIVGAISGLFGYKADPETGYWNSYQQAAIQAGVDSGSGTSTASVPVGWLPSSQLQQLADSNASPATTFEGLMDIHGDTGIPMYDQYGRMGGGTFIKDMTTQIDNAAKAGTITSYSSPQQIYTKIIAPWIAKMGTWSNPNSQAIVALIISMIGQYTSGNISDWSWINGTNYLQQQTTPFANFTSNAYAPASWYNPQTPTGATTSNPIAYNQPTTTPTGAGP